MNNVLFLDYDGVVNNILWFIDEHGRRICSYNKYVTTDGERHMVCNDWNALQWVGEICIKYDIKIVVSSSWRILHDYQLALRLGGLPDKVEILGCTGEIHTDDYKHDRGREIAEYIYNNKVDNYIIFDDENCFLPEQQPYFVHCKHNGFGFLEYNEAKLVCAKFVKNE